VDLLFDCSEGTFGLPGGGKTLAIKSFFFSSAEKRHQGGATMIAVSGRTVISLAVVSVCTALLVPLASADIIKIQSVQACNVIGLDPSPAASQGGVHCNTGNTPFSLTGVLNGSLKLFVGNSQTPSWNVVNDTGGLLTSLTLYYSGALASNAFIDMQVSGTTLFSSCVATTATNVVTSDSNCGSGDVTGNNPALPVKLVWSGGTGVAAGGQFNIGTASFAHAGEDAGCISGTPNCQTVPEPSSLTLVCVGFLGAALIARRRWARAVSVLQTNSTRREPVE
jgi:PEP-CTERM motif